MEYLNVFIILVALAGCRCQNITTSTINNSTTTTLQPQTNATIATTLAPVVNETTTAAPTNTTTTTITTTTNTTTTNTTTTPTTTQATKKVSCESTLCPPYSLCDQSVCLMKCPNVTMSTNNDTVSEQQVCGSDDVTYASFDELKMKSCEAMKMVTKKADGACKEVSEKSEKKTKYVVIVVVLVLVLVVVIAIAAFWIYKKKNSNSKDLKDGEKAGDNLL